MFGSDVMAQNLDFDKNVKCMICLNKANIVQAQLARRLS